MRYRKGGEIDVVGVTDFAESGGHVSHHIRRALQHPLGQELASFKKMILVTVLVHVRKRKGISL